MTDDCKFAYALLDTLPDNTYCPITFVVNDSEMDRFVEKIEKKLSEKQIDITRFDNLNQEITQSEVVLLTLSVTNKEVLSEPDLLYRQFGLLILAKTPSVAVVTKSVLETALEGRMKALLFYGVAHEMKIERDNND